MLMSGRADSNRRPSCSQTRSGAIRLPAETIVPAAQSRHQESHGYGLVRSSSVEFGRVPSSSVDSATSVLLGDVDERFCVKERTRKVVIRDFAGQERFASPLEYR